MILMAKRLVLGALLLVPSLAHATSVEVNLPATPVISPYTYWCTSPTNCDPGMKGRFYNATGVRVGNDFYIYVQGGAYKNITTGPGSECTAVGEEILLFKAPWTSQGLRSPFNLCQDDHTVQDGRPRCALLSGGCIQVVVGW